MIKVLFASLLLVGMSVQSGHAQNRITRRSAEIILDRLHNDVKRAYFDSTFNGVDIDARKDLIRSELKKFSSAGEMNYIIASYLKPLNDSHTYYIPPPFLDDFDYGFDITFAGADALIINVQPGSSAEAVGLKKGDRLNMIDGVTIDRTNLAPILYEYYVLAPREVMQLVVTTPEGRQRQVPVKIRIRKGLEADALWGPLGRARLKEAEDSVRKITAHRYASFDKKAFLWKMPGFWHDDDNIGKLVDRAIGYETLILDLRGNGGGSVDALRELVSRVITTETEIATFKERKRTEVIKAKPAKNAFTGQIFAIVDSESASASEVFARLMQLTGRGKVIGDQTAGAVRVSQMFDYVVGNWYAQASITVSDLIMRDGGVLEGVGVKPDEMVTLKYYDVAEGSDTVLSYALGLAGVKVDPTAAAKLLEN